MDIVWAFKLSLSSFNYPVILKLLLKFKNIKIIKWLATLKWIQSHVVSYTSESSYPVVLWISTVSLVVS